MPLSLPGTGAMTLPSGTTVSADPATGDRSSLVATMKKFADEFGVSLGQPGYQKLPSGLIIQWGAYVFSGASSTSISFPIAFTTACYMFGAFNPNTSTFVTSTGISVSGATVAAAGSLSASGYWIAIGK